MFDSEKKEEAKRSKEGDQIQSAGAVSVKCTRRPRQML